MTKLVRKAKRVSGGKMAVFFSSQNHAWRTPPEFFSAVNAAFNFDFDLAASTANALCPQYYTAADDSISQSWEKKRGWLNPPYGRRLGRWTTKAAETAIRKGCVIVMLVPARTDAAWFWDAREKATTVLMKGRIHFRVGKRKKSGAPFPSMLMVFHRGATGAVVTWDWKAGEPFPVEWK